MGTQFLNTNLEKITGGGILHWDGKIFKKLTHVGDSKERVVILIDQNGEDTIIGDPNCGRRQRTSNYIRDNEFAEQVENTALQDNWPCFCYNK